MEDHMYSKLAYTGLCSQTQSWEVHDSGSNDLCNNEQVLCNNEQVAALDEAVARYSSFSYKDNLSTTASEESAKTKCYTSLKTRLYK